ncbi:MAG TPA: 2-amino-4-hydroxy-6-hydroxymethyldihydropteridine diphosphokinase [Chloroflexota bacterium]
MSRRVWIGLGGNLDGPAARVLAAADRLAGLGPLRLSSLYETAPWGRADQPWFVNAVAELETALAPAALLAELQRIELELGRVRNERWGPRAIDLDYLLDEDGPVDQPALTVPHPRLENRAFALAPLADLRPELVLPSGRRLADRLRELLPEQPLRRLEPAHTIAPCRPPS